jgi:hypothetical protein
MKYFIDLHIHTTLSPCADNDMTPNNIVNMAMLKGLDFIAITDHNSARNVEAVIECARGKGIIIVPGMEVESAEEVHMVCLFPNLDAVYNMEELVQVHLPNLKNDVKIFGAQVIYNSRDEIIGYDDRLLVTATSLSIDRIKASVEDLGGIAIPSHVDRQSFSVISNLGFIPPELNFTVVELSKHTNKVAFLANNPFLSRYMMIQNSDAHHLEDISEAEEAIDLVNKSIGDLLNCFQLKNS